MRWSSIFIFSFILNSFVFQVHCQVKMVLFYGIVLSGWESNVTFSKSVGDCTNGCLEAEHCFLMHFRDETCYFYSYLNTGQLISVVEVHKSQRAYVAFKTDISNIPNNTCPESYNDLKFSVTSSIGEKYSWIKSSGQWKFANCRTGWKRFERDDETVVCLGLFNSFGYGTQPDAIIKCAQENATLTGIASLEEAKWVQVYMVSNAHLMWIGGERDCPDTPCTTFKWTDGYTTSYEALSNAQLTYGLNSDENENCLAIGRRNGSDVKIFSTACDSTLPFLFCGYKIDF